MMTDAQRGYLLVAAVLFVVCALLASWMSTGGRMDVESVPPPHFINTHKEGW